MCTTYKVTPSNTNLHKEQTISCFDTTPCNGHYETTNLSFTLKMSEFNNFGFSHWSTKQIPTSVIMHAITYNSPQYCGHFRNHSVTKPCLMS